MWRWIRARLDESSHCYPSVDEEESRVWEWRSVYIPAKSEMSEYSISVMANDDLSSTFDPVVVVLAC